MHVPGPDWVHIRHVKYHGRLVSVLCVFCSGVGSGGCVVRFDVHGE